MLTIWDNKVRSPVSIVSLHGLMQRIVDPSLPAAERLRRVRGVVYRDWLAMTLLDRVCFPRNWRLVCPSPTSLNWTPAHDAPLHDLLEEERQLGAETLVVLGFSDGATTAARLVERLPGECLLVCHSGLRPRGWAPTNTRLRRLYIVSAQDPFQKVVEDTGEMHDESVQQGRVAELWTQPGLHPTGWKGRFRGHWFSPETAGKMAEWVAASRASTYLL